MITKGKQAAAALFVLAVGLVGTAASAGARLEMEQRSPDGKSVTAHMVYYLDAGRLRVETKTEEGDDYILIYRADKPVAWTIDRNDGTYTEMTPETAVKLKEQMDQMHQQMEAQMAKLPPEQRKAMEEMMGKAMGEPTGQPITTRVLGRNEAVGSYTCTHYELLRGGDRMSEIWAAPLSQVHVTPTDFKTLEGLSKLFGPLAEQAPGSNLTPTTGSGEKIEGFPVRSRTYANGEVVSEERLLAADTQSFSDDLFTLPAGLHKVEPDQGP